MKRSLIIMLVAAVVFIVIAYLVGGNELVLKGFNVSYNTAIKSALMLFVSFILIGQLQVLLTKEVLDTWLNKFSGIKGVIISAIAGGLFPGGPYIFYPFVASFKEKAIPFYILISFIFGKQIYDFSRIPMEMSLVNPQVTLIRYLITLPMPILAGMAVKYYNDKYINKYPSMEAGEKNAANNNNT